MEMKKLIMVGAVAFAACAGAEEKSFWGTLFSSAEETDAVAETAAKADPSIAKLSQQLKDLKAKLKAKLEEYKAREAQKSEEERKKAEERKAKLEQTKKDSKDLIDSFKSLFD